MKAAVLAALFAAVLLPALPAQAQQTPPDAERSLGAQWRGVVVPPLPSGWRELGGHCIGPDHTPEAVCATMVSLLRDEQSGLHAVLATRPLRHADGTPVRGDRKALELVTDAIEPDALAKAGHELSAGLCQRDGRDDRRIVAIVRFDPQADWYAHAHLRGVWRLDEDGRFQPIPVDGVRCLNEGYGYDG